MAPKKKVTLKPVFIPAANGKDIVIKLRHYDYTLGEDFDARIRTFQQCVDDKSKRYQDTPAWRAIWAAEVHLHRISIPRRYKLFIFFDRVKAHKAWEQARATEQVDFGWPQWAVKAMAAGWTPPPHSAWAK